MNKRVILVNLNNINDARDVLGYEFNYSVVYAECNGLASMLEVVDYVKDMSSNPFLL